MMKRLFAASASVALLASPVYAADVSPASDAPIVVAQATAPGAGGDTTERRGAPGAASPQFISAGTYEFAANDLIGFTVRGTGDEDIGTVDDLLLGTNGEVVGVVIASGGFLGLGEKQVAVPWDAVTVVPDQEQVQVAISQEEIADAPDYEPRD